MGASSLSDSDNSICTIETPLLAHKLPTRTEMLQLEALWHMPKGLELQHFGSGGKLMRQQGGLDGANGVV
jgi:hypothetical protein